MITTILFDIGDTLVRAAEPATPVDDARRTRPLAGVLPTLQAFAPLPSYRRRHATPR